MGALPGLIVKLSVFVNCRFPRCLRAVLAIFLVAVSVENKRVVHDAEIQHLPYHVLDRLDARIAELHYFMTICTNQMVVLLVTVRLFKLRQVFAKLVLGNQVAIHQNVQCVVDGRPAHPVTLVLHADIQFIYIEMILPGVNFFEDRKALGRFTKSLIFQVSR